MRKATLPGFSDVITLYNFGPFFGLPDASPFCLKVDLYLRAAGLEYQVRSGAQNLRKAPKGKLPYIDDDGTMVADSAFIISYLKTEYGDPLDGGLGAEQKAVAHAFTRMLEENLYWCLVHSRWIDEAVWPVVRKKFFTGLPAPLRMVVSGLVRRRIARILHGQGLGRHRSEEITEIARRDLAALSAYLGSRTYFLGERVTTLDIAVFAFVAELVVPPLDCELQRMARSFENLVLFVERVRERYYSEQGPGTGG